MLNLYRSVPTEQIQSGNVLAAKKRKGHKGAKDKKHPDLLTVKGTNWQMNDG